MVRQDAIHSLAAAFPNFGIALPHGQSGLADSEKRTHVLHPSLGNLRLLWVSWRRVGKVPVELSRVLKSRQVCGRSLLT